MASGSPVPVAVVGFGTMGAGIAHLAAAAGHPVLAFDAVEGVVAQGREALRRRLEQSVAKGRLSEEAAGAIQGRITPCFSLDDLAPARLVVEAVAEDLEAKREVFRRLEGIVGDGCILATNTSSLSVTAIAAGLRLPGRVVGMHFFNPAPVMPLVEVVSGLGTSEDVAETASALARDWGKTPVRVRSTPGFIVNRVARPFYGEALRLLAERAANAATIDALWREGAGFRMGPFELMDLVGIEVSLAVSESIFAAMGCDPRFAPSPLQRERVAAGHLGRKSGRGFYDYGPGAQPAAPVTVPPQPPPQQVAVVGDLGVAAPLAAALAQAGIPIETRKGEGPGYFLTDGIRLELTDGRLATERAAALSADVVVFDLMGDYSVPGRVGIAVADGSGPGALAAAAGLLQAAGKTVSLLDDTPGLVVMRTVALLANLGSDAVHQGICDAAAVDIAMRLGAAYPRGPLEWADMLGPATVVTVLDHLARTYGEDRYRVSPLLRRRAMRGSALESGPRVGSR